MRSEIQTGGKREQEFEEENKLHTIGQVGLEQDYRGS